LELEARWGGDGGTRSELGECGEFSVVVGGLGAARARGRAEATGLAAVTISTSCSFWTIQRHQRGGGGGKEEKRQHSSNKDRNISRGEPYGEKRLLGKRLLGGTRASPTPTVSGVEVVVLVTN